MKLVAGCATKPRPPAVKRTRLWWRGPEGVKQITAFPTSHFTHAKIGAPPCVSKWLAMHLPSVHFMHVATMDCESERGARRRQPCLCANLPSSVGAVSTSINSHNGFADTHIDWHTYYLHAGQSSQRGCCWLKRAWVAEAAQKPKGDSHKRDIDKQRITLIL